MNLLHAQNLATKLITNYELKQWQFKFDRAKRRFGCCNFSHKVISISRYFVELNSAMQVQDVILHEIAHALVGSRQGHNKIWQQKAREIGCRTTRCFSKQIKIPPLRYIAICTHCKKSFQAQRKRKVACAECCRKYNHKKYSAKYRIQFLNFTQKTNNI